MGSSRMGCEHRYCFSTVNEIISKHRSWYEELGVRYVFEIRTNFTVKGKFDGDGVDREKVIGSEMFGVGVFEVEKDEKGNAENLCGWVGTRLRDYWMCFDEIREFVRKALAFANDQNVQQGMPIPIGVDIGVCSVQQEGEPIDAAVARAIKPECLYPLSLCPWVQGLHPALLDDGLDIYRMQELRHRFPTTRAIDNVEECVVCSTRPTIGSQITTLKCGHAFHYHCIAKWLWVKDTCPTCHQQALARQRYQRS